MGMVDPVFPGGIVGDVEELVVEVMGVADSVFVVAGVPDLAGRLLAGGEGVSPLDELDAAGGALVHCGCDQEVDVVGHDGEGVELELGCVPVAEECCDEEFGVYGSLEMAMPLVGEDGQGVGALLLPDRGHDERAYSRG